MWPSGSTGLGVAVRSVAWIEVRGWGGGSVVLNCITVIFGSISFGCCTLDGP